MEVQFEIELTKKQQEAYDVFHEKDTKELVLLFSRQSGKSTLAEVLMMEAALETPKSTVFYISPQYKHGQKIYREITSALADTNLIKKKNGSDLIIELTNGSLIQFFTAQSPDSIRGNTCTKLLVLDEEAYLPILTPTGEDLYFNVIQPITKTRKPKIIHISTPAGKDGIFYHKYLSSIEGDGSVKSVISTIYDDPFVTVEEIEKTKRESPRLAFEQEYECRFLDSALTALPGFENCFEEIDIDKKITKNSTVWAGIDWSSVGSDDTVVTLINQEGYVKQYIIDDKDYDRKYRKIAEILDSYPRLQACYVEVNGIGSPMFDGLKKVVKCKSKLYEFVTTNNSKNDAVETLQLLIDGKEIHFPESNRTLFKQFGVFTYQLSKTKKITYAAKPGYHDDCVLSLCFAVKAKEDYKSFDVKKDVVFIRQKNMTIR